MTNDEGIEIAVARTRSSNPTEPIPKVAATSHRIVIEANDPASLAEVFETIARIVRERGRIVLLDE